MKFFFPIVAWFLLTASVFAQAPQKMSYQAVIRNSSNALITSTTVGMQISILKGSSNGTPVYVETQKPSTNANALVSLEIGTGTVISGTFATINWATGPYFIKTETDPTGGTAYTIAGINELMSVPYALFSANGTPGATGPQGAAGVTGSIGLTGAAGAIGLTGAIGPSGPTGAAGAQGIAGTNGTNGAVGVTGTIGLTGLTGPAGPIGLTGPEGLPGKNALIKTSSESIGANCQNGGIKIEAGIDINENNILESVEIDNNLTQYICNSILDIINPNTNIHGVVNLSEGQSLNWIVPNGVFRIQLILNGSQGGDSGRVCDSSICWPVTIGWGGAFRAVTFNLNVIPGQTFTFLVGVNGIDGIDGSFNTNSTSLPAAPGTDGTLTKVDLNGVEILSISGGTGGVSWVGAPSSSAFGTRGTAGQIFYTLGKGLLNLQTSTYGSPNFEGLYIDNSQNIHFPGFQGFYNLYGSAKIRVEY